MEIENVAISGSTVVVNFKVFCGFIKRKNYKVKITGSSPSLGQWDLSKSPYLQPSKQSGWFDYSLSCPQDDLPFEFAFFKILLFYYFN